ncbi:MAG: hypothetical protein NTY77_19350 [Elusimicrobia bacterium]|nr:hypothetical protein [Elusimicrobiota bacterium]
MCLRTPAADPSECDCYECVEARRKAAAQSQGAQCCQPQPAQEPDVLESWRGAFQEAYREVQLEIFKAKIKKDLSKTMEKTAALVMETMITEIREATRREHSQKDLREKLTKIIESAGGD